MIAADTMAKRTNLRKYPEQKIVNADLILYYIAVLDKYNWAWFPILYVYGEEMGKIENFKKNLDVILKKLKVYLWQIIQKNSNHYWCPLNSLTVIVTKKALELYLHCCIILNLKRFVPFYRYNKYRLWL